MSETNAHQASLQYFSMFYTSMSDKYRNKHLVGLAFTSHSWLTFYFFLPQVKEQSSKIWTVYAQLKCTNIAGWLATWSSKGNCQFQGSLSFSHVSLVNSTWPSLAYPNSPSFTAPGQPSPAYPAQPLSAYMSPVQLSPTWSTHFTLGQSSLAQSCPAQPSLHQPISVQSSSTQSHLI